MGVSASQETPLHFRLRQYIAHNHASRCAHGFSCGGTTNHTRVSLCAGSFGCARATGVLSSSVHHRIQKEGTLTPARIQAHIDTQKHALIRKHTHIHTCAHDRIHTDISTNTLGMHTNTEDDTWSTLRRLTQTTLGAHQQARTYSQGLTKAHDGANATKHTYRHSQRHTRANAEEHTQTHRHT